MGAHGRHPLRGLISLSSHPILLQTGTDLPPITLVPDTRKPMVSGLSGLKKFDFFFQKSIKNIDHQTIEFEECYKNSVLKEDPRGDVSFRIPTIDDLIRLKKIRKPNVKDEQDIEYLLKAKRLFRNSKNKS